MRNLLQNLHPLLRGNLRDVQNSHPLIHKVFTENLSSALFYDDLTYFDFKVIYWFLMDKDQRKPELQIPDILNFFNYDGYTITVIATQKGRFYKADINGKKITEQELLQITGLTKKHRVHFERDIEECAQKLKDYKFDIYTNDVS